MLTDLLSSPQPLVRYGVAASMVFLPLYILQSMGYKWAYRIALGAFLTVVLFNAQKTFAAKGV